MSKVMESGIEDLGENVLTDEDLEEISMIFAEATAFSNITRFDGVWKNRGQNYGLTGFELIDGAY